MLLVRIFLRRDVALRILSSSLLSFEVAASNDQGSCHSCSKYDVRSAYRRRYNDKSSIPEVLEEDLVTVDDSLHSDLIASFKLSLLFRYTD